MCLMYTNSVRSIVLCGDSHLTPTNSRGTLKLGPRLAAAGWTVEQLAVGGLSTRAARTRFEVLPAAEWTLLSFGANDAAPWKQVPLAEFEDNLGVLIDRCQSERVLVLAATPVIERPGAVFARSNAVVETYASVAREVAKAHRAIVLEWLRPLALDGSHHAPDGVHLNDASYEILAESVLAVIS